jgi:hypothetical protein
MKYLIAVAAVLLASCGDTGTVDTGAAANSASSDEMDIAESVLKSLYGDNASAVQSSKVGASLCFGDKDPPLEFIARFKDLDPPAFPCSASEFNEKRGELVMRGTTKPMISFSVKEIKILSSTEAVAVGGYYEAGLSSGGYTFKLTKINGRWVVKDQLMDWIS